MRVCEWFCISSSKQTSRCTKTPQASFLSVQTCLCPVSLVVKPPIFCKPNRKSHFVLPRHAPLRYFTTQSDTSTGQRCQRTEPSSGQF